ncbi:MAG: rhodanese-like domain-containing protein [Candidatus Eremiobacteraeota bacterium]|nr:rhodanese-like domain-containing protein [Candidatus Eremiobacteraeota bacterium]
MNNSLNRVEPNQIAATTPIVDVRKHAGNRQIRGAVRYDVGYLRAADRLVLPLPHSGPIAVYADSDAIANEIASLLRAAGYTGAAVLEGGFDAWRNAGLPVEELTQEQPIAGEPQAGLHDL